MGEFKKVNFKLFGKKSLKSTPDVLYWKKLGVPVFLKEFGPIDYIDFSPIEPHYFAVTSSVRVQVYSPVTRLVHKNLTKFQKSAYGGSFRNDGKLICAGGEENLVKLFDVSSKSLLRVFEGHTAPVHRCFFTVDNTHIASFSDDMTVNLWDVPSERKVVSYNEHNLSFTGMRASNSGSLLLSKTLSPTTGKILALKDYIRAGAVSPVSCDIILSGSYDGFVKLYDKRSESVVFSLNHGSPVESIIFLPTGGIFLSAGGLEIKVWDAICGGRLLARLCHHHKTVTSLCLASRGSRVLSGSLDRHVNIYDVATFQKVYSLDYPNSVLSVGISPNDETIAVGMVDGLVSVSKKDAEARMASQTTNPRSFRYANEVKSVDVFIKDKKMSKMARYDTHLKKFEHTKALKVVLAPVITNKTPQITVAVLQELLYRKVLHVAIGGYEAKTIEPLLRFLIKYLGDYRFTRVLIDVSNVFMDVYEGTVTECGPEAVSLLLRLSARLNEEIDLTESLLGLEGCVNLMVAASISDSNNATVSAPPALKPSDNARDFIVNIN